MLSLGTDGHWDDMMFGEGISVLLSFSLMKRGQSSRMFSVHPLVHCWSQEHMSKAEQQEMCETGSLILSNSVAWTWRSEDYALQWLIFQHIKANELNGSSIGLMKQYYDDKWAKFAQVLSENGVLHLRIS